MHMRNVIIFALILLLGMSAIAQADSTWVVELQASNMAGDGCFSTPCSLGTAPDWSDDFREGEDFQLTSG